jgi:predicted phage-related endonuclease
MCIELSVEQGTYEWKKIRKTYLTASLSGDVLGYGKGYPIDYFNFLKKDEDDNLQSPKLKIFFDIGSKYELYIRDIHSILINQRIRTCGIFIGNPNMIEYGKLAASPDGVIVEDDGTDNQDIICEYKTIINYTYDNSWSRCAYGIPKVYLIQTMQEMYLSGRKNTHFLAYCVRTDELICKNIEFSQNFWNWAYPKLCLFSDWVFDRKKIFLDFKDWDEKPNLEDIIKVGPIIRKNDGYIIPEKINNVTQIVYNM